LGKADVRFAEAATKMLARIADKIQSAPAAWPASPPTLRFTGD